MNLTSVSQSIRVRHNIVIIKDIDWGNMFKIRLILISFLILFFTGCQHTNKTQVAPVTANQQNPVHTQDTDLKIPTPDQNIAGNSSQQKQEDTDLAPIAVSITKTPLPDKTQDSAVPETESSQTVPPLSDSEATAQSKIDQALELCNYAQQMWEKGKIDEALNNLDSAYYSILEIEPDAHAEFIQQKEDIRFLISKRILEIYASRQIVINGSHNEIPITINKHVESEIKRLTGVERKFFIQSLERSYRYRPYIIKELKKAGLPEQLSWLPLIESGYKVRALSKARALGLWQFIPSTGYKFGLNRNYYIDERLDPEKSTLAAINYLKELHNLFGDWTTALAAYNCGEGRVLRIIRKQRINYLDNFWDLYQSLPRETSRYVPRFLATLHIVNNLEKYNIKITRELHPIEYQICKIKKQVRLKDIAKEISVSTNTLKELNPELRYSILPPEQYQLRIPVEKADLFLSKIDTIKATYSPPPMYVFHRVRRGETVSGIAKKYKASIRSICLVNNIRNSRIYAGKVLKIPSRSNSRYTTSQSTTNIPAGKSVSYKVKRGDSLWNIARKFGTTTKHIMMTNNLSTTGLSIGQRLTITNGKTQVLSKKDSQTYLVRSGDSPFKIAKKHNMSLERFLTLNHLNKRSKIFPGQQLIVE